MRFLGRSVIGVAVAGILSLALAGVASASVTNVYWTRAGGNRNFATPSSSASPRDVISALAGFTYYELDYQSDGNLVLYKFNLSAHASVAAVWQSHTYGEGATRFSEQADGNLVIYRKNTPLWESCTNENVSKYALSLNGSTGVVAHWYWDGSAYAEDWAVSARGFLEGACP